MWPIVIAVAAIVILGLIVVIALQPADFIFERSAVIPAPPDRVFPHVNALRNWEAWSPWAKKDPAMEKRYDGPEEGVGARYAWNGNKDVGVGSMEIIETRPDDLVRLRLDFEKPMKATNTVDFMFKPEGEGTRVSWIMRGRNNFVGKAFGLFLSMDKMVGKDFEQGLASLGSAVESTPGS